MEHDVPVLHDVGCRVAVVIRAKGPVPSERVRLTNRWGATMYDIRSTTPMTPIDGHVDIDFADREGWTENMGATTLPIMIGDDHCGPFVALSYVEPTGEQMPLSFAHAHASHNW